MTDRETLIEMLCEAEAARALGISMEGCAEHLIANGVVVREWIPVTERLPVVQGYYMVCHKNSKTIAERFYYKDCPDLFVRVTGDPVTHWMPLPEPPKEVE